MKRVSLYILFILLISISGTLHCNKKTAKQLDQPVIDYQKTEQEAFRYLTRKNYKKAKETYLNILKTNPQIGKWFYCYLGESLIGEKDFKQAYEYYTKAIEYDHSQLDALITLIPRGLLRFEPLSLEEMETKSLAYSEALEKYLPYSSMVSDISGFIRAKKDEGDIKWRLSAIASPNLDRGYLALYGDKKKYREGFFRDAYQLMQTARLLFDCGSFSLDRNTLDNAITYYRYALYGGFLIEEFTALWSPEFGEVENDERDELVDWSPILFIRLAECYIGKAAELIRRNKNKPLSPESKEEIMGYYRTAIYYYMKSSHHQAFYGDTSLLDSNFQKISELYDCIK